MPLVIYDMSQNNIADLRKFLTRDRMVTTQLLELLEPYLDEETSKLYNAAERSLLDPSLRDAAIMQLGRVDVLREFERFLHMILKEQTDGR